MINIFLTAFGSLEGLQNLAWIKIIVPGFESENNTVWWCFQLKTWKF